MSNDIKETIAEIEIFIGQRLRERRERLGMSRQGLAASIGVTVQQLAKYENSLNKISVSRLMMAAQILEKKIDYFLPDIKFTTNERDKALANRIIQAKTINS